MDKEQIETMEKIMCKECVEASAMTCRFTKEEMPCDFAKYFAEALYNSGYRKIEMSKQTEKQIRKEAIKEFTEKLKQKGCIITEFDWNEYLKIDIDTFNELLKEYEVEE